MVRIVGTLSDHTQELFLWCIDRQSGTCFRTIKVKIFPLFPKSSCNLVHK